MNKPLVIAMMGLPRSGKSTAVRDLAKEWGAPIVRKDAIRLALHGHRYWGPAEPQVRGAADLMLRSLILSGHRVVIVDETHFSRNARNFIKSGDWRTVFYEIKTPASICKERAIRSLQPDLVPIIDEMMDRYQPLERDEMTYQHFMEGVDRDLLDWFSEKS